MLKVKKIKISNIGRFVGEHVVDLSLKSPLIQVDAKNLNTGGSSGSAKTTIFNAIDYALGVNDVPTTVLQSRLTKNQMSVTLTLQKGEVEYDIIRGKSGGLSILENGIEKVSGDVKSAEIELDKIVGIPRSHLRKVYHKRQKEGGFFLNLTPKKCHEFLTDILDLNVWGQRLEKAELDAKTSDAKSQELLLRISERKGSLAELKSTLGEMTPPSLGWDPSAVALIESSLSLSKDSLLKKTSQMNQEIASVQAPATPPIVDRSGLVEIKKEIDTVNALNSVEKEIKSKKLVEAREKLFLLENKEKELKRQIADGSSAEIESESVKQDILKIKSGTCPTCNQSWSSGHVSLDAQVQKLKRLTSKIQTAMLAKETLLVLGSEISELSKSYEEAAKDAKFGGKEAELSALESKLLSQTSYLDKEQDLLNRAYANSLSVFESQKNSVQLKYVNEIKHLQNDYEEKQRLLSQKKAELDSYLKSKTFFESNNQKIKDRIEQEESNISLMEKEYSDASGAALTASESAKVIRSYMNNLFEGALDLIAHRATSILSKIPAMATSTIYFESFKEMKNGSVKDEISAIITMDGEMGVPIASMSGGERTAIDLAVDLAVIETIEDRAGKGLDLFILDEPFDGIDAVSREQCLELLKANSQGKRVIIVDHSNETKEMVQDRVVVVREGQTSRIEQ